ncbi:PglL family O-oligosaccharyltransferase [Marinobacter sp. 2_MG-2023]|uniref:PglL family O-oligosaccharyltransferase n=1 Tax=Marinobacter sp. 2_MG-2023 TaxID=3062679 RepID=UPI0026E20A31|nr:Wzy polymerase domain-containing protein [Marinobacter sp. 2_MG-2023]
MAGGILLFSRDRQFTMSPVLFFVVALILVTIVSVALNSYSLEATWRWYLISLAFCVVVVLGSAELIRAEGVNRYINALVAVIWLGALVYAVLSLLRYYGVLQFVIPGLEPSRGRLGGIWGQPNLTSTTVWLGLLASIRRFDWRNAPYKLSISIFIYGWVIACAASRMSWLYVAGLVSLIIVSSFPVWRKAETSAIRGRLVLALLVVVVLFFVVPVVNKPVGGWLTDLGMLDRPESIALTDRDISQDAARLSEFRKLGNSISELSVQGWIVGMGPGNYARFSANADLDLRPEDLVQVIWLHSHNLFTMVFVELGLLGFMLLITLCGAIGWRLLKKPINSDSFFVTGALGIIFIHSLLEFPLWYPWFLFLTCCLTSPLFPAYAVKSEIPYLKPVVGGLIVLMTLGLLVNVGSQYRTIVRVAADPSPDGQEYQSLALLANDSLMGPYAVLRRYRDFAPEESSLDWQLREVQRIKAWQPRDLVLLREYSLLVLKRDVAHACEAGRQTAYRYPRSAPIMLEHAVMSKKLKPAEVIRLAECIERGLAPWGETVPSMKKRNLESQR